MREYEGRKKLRRLINHYIASMNKSLEQDNVYKGNFYIHNDASYYYRYEDRSGWFSRHKLTIVDRETGKTSTKYFTNYDIGGLIPHCYGREFWWWVNNFIAIDCAYWERHRR